MSNQPRFSSEENTPHLESGGTWSCAETADKWEPSAHLRAVLRCHVNLRCSEESESVRVSLLIDLFWNTRRRCSEIPFSKSSHNAVKLKGAYSFRTTFLYVRLKCGWRVFVCVYVRARAPLGGDKGAHVGRISGFCILFCSTATCANHRGSDWCFHYRSDAAFRGAVTSPVITASLSVHADATPK